MTTTRTTRRQLTGQASRSIGRVLARTIPLLAVVMVLAGCASMQTGEAMDGAPSYDEGRTQYLNTLENGTPDAKLLLATARTTDEQDQAADLLKVAAVLGAAESGQWDEMNRGLNGLRDQRIRDVLASRLAEAGLPVDRALVASR